MPAKPTRQQRSLDKRNRILVAMDSLLRAKPFPEISVADVASKANVAPATIYQRFDNVDATASILLELYYIKVQQWATGGPTLGVADLPIFDALKTIAANAYDQVAQLGYVMRPAYLYSRQRPGRVGPVWAQLEERALEGFVAFLAQRSKEIRIQDRTAAGALLAYLFNFMLLGPLLHSEDPHLKMTEDREEFAHSLATIAYRYLVYDR